MIDEDLQVACPRCGGRGYTRLRWRLLREWPFLVHWADRCPVCRGLGLVERQEGSRYP
jgi:DnaJ-class molecular chaperone